LGFTGGGGGDEMDGRADLALQDLGFGVWGLGFRVHQGVGSGEETDYNGDLAVGNHF
jgi:hypothetical protein